MTLKDYAKTLTVLIVSLDSQCLKSRLTAVEQTAYIYLNLKTTIKVLAALKTQIQFRKVNHKKQTTSVHSRGTCNWFSKAAKQCGSVWTLGNELGTKPHVSHPGSCNSHSAAW